MNEKLEIQVEKTIKYLNENCSRSIKNEIKNASFENLYNFHFGLGIWIRDNILKENSEILLEFKKLEIDNKDDISSILIYEFYKYLNCSSKEYEKDCENFDKGVEMFGLD